MKRGIEIPASLIWAFVTYTFLKTAVYAFEDRLDYWDAFGFVVACIAGWQLWFTRNQSQEGGREV